MHATILALATEVPKTVLFQERFHEAAVALLGLKDQQIDLLKRITDGSQISKRHVIVSDFVEDGFRGNFFGREKKAVFPTMEKRNDHYKEAAPKLAESVCHKALDQWGGDRKSITHIISVSCTGMIAPGIEFILIDRLRLSLEVERLGINFMGCFGAFKGVAIAKALALENPNHRVLVVCTELCSLHFQEDHNKDTMVANAIFADGSAAIVVGIEPREGEKALFEIHKQGSQALKNTLEHMTWEAGDYGYKMRLNNTIPGNIENHISQFVQRLIGPNLSSKQCTWAVHPGGKAILEGITRACKLHKEQISASWKILHEYGNMSSPTFLFVLQEIMKVSQRKWVVGLGFGPGLSIEGLLLKRADNVAE